MADNVERQFAGQLLVDLVRDPRDPGYEAAAKRRGPNHRQHWYEGSAVVLGCLTIGFLLAVAWSHTHRGAPAAATLHNRLVDRVRSAEKSGDELAADESTLNARLDQIRNAALPGSSALLRELSRSQLLAGELGATGPGLEVRLSDPTASASPTTAAGRGNRAPVEGDHILTDRDVRSVVNELWAEGAEAIAVNGMRLTPTSAIRFAGDAVLVDFQPIASPYVIDALGSADGLATGFAQSETASRLQTLSGARGVGFSFRESGSLTLPAGPVSVLHYARTKPAARTQPAARTTPAARPKPSR